MSHHRAEPAGGTASATRRAALPDWIADVHSPLDVRLGIELLEVSADGAVGRMPVAGNTQPAGLLHGGASCALAESLGLLAALAYGRESDRVPVGVDINATHHRPVRSGWVTGTATALHRARSLVTYEVVITDDQGHRTCTARITCALIKPKQS